MAYCARGEFLEVQGNKKMAFFARGVRGKSGRRARKPRPPERNLLRGGGKDYFVFVSFANVHHVHYLLYWNGFVCVD